MTLAVGQRVRKHNRKHAHDVTGPAGYEGTGVVLARVVTLRGDLLYVVELLEPELLRGTMAIFRPGQLDPLAEAPS